MPIEFDVKITANDMYRFNMYHIYTSFTGIFSILAAVLGFVAAVGTYGKVDTMYTVLYIIFGIVFLFYFPLTLKMRAARQISMSEALKSTLHYMLDVKVSMYLWEKKMPCWSGNRFIKWCQQSIMF